jgi:hypothetical protein
MQLAIATYFSASVVYFAVNVGHDIEEEEEGEG